MVAVEVLQGVLVTLPSEKPWIIGHAFDSFGNATLIAHWLDKMWSLLGDLLCRALSLGATSGCDHVLPM